MTDANGLKRGPSALWLLGALEISEDEYQFQENGRLDFASTLSLQGVNDNDVVVGMLTELCRLRERVEALEEKQNDRSAEIG